MAGVRVTCSPYPILDFAQVSPGDGQSVSFANHIRDIVMEPVGQCHNFQLEPGETASSVVVNLVGSDHQSFDVPAEDVRFLASSSITQVMFRLPNGLAIGESTLTVKARGQASNAGIIRIRN